MNSTLPTDDRSIEWQLRDMNEALLVSSVHQHELTEHAERSEAALRESYERFEALFEASPVGMYLVDGELRIRLVSRKARPVFGDLVLRDGGELIGSEFVEVIHILWPPECADDIVARFRHTLKTGEPFVSPEFSQERYDRKVREYYDWQIHRIALPGGKYGVVCYFNDISARVFAEQALRESEVRYRRLFESSKDGILILKADDGTITDVNPSMVQMLGYSHEEFLGKELWQIGLFQDISACQEMIRELQAKGFVRYEELSLENTSGQKIEVEVVANVYQEDNHSIIQCNIRDITARSLLEHKTKEQAKSLADLGRRKDEFLAMLSHELRNPLAPIANAVQLLRLQKNEGQVQQKARTIIERQVGQLTRLIDDLLEVSRIITGRIRLQCERSGLNGIVERAVETARPLMDQRRHELKVSLSAQPIWLNADAARLEQVVVNLLTNAAKYTADGGHIWLTVQQEGDEAVLRVRDTGVGIAPELLPHIFDLFTQAERSLARSEGGLGIGLCLVQRLVEMHGGRVEADSVLGQGSEFVVRLPVTVTPAPQPPSTPKETTEATGSSLRVLVVDDNVDAAETWGMLLKESGHDVRTAHDGPTALDEAVNYRPNVVLLDIGLPGMNGLEVAKKMREHPLLHNIMLIAMTGYGQEADRQRSQAAGFDHHFVKPVSFGQVKQILATLPERAT